MKTDQAFSTILSTKIQRLNAYQTVMRLAVAAASRNFELLRTVGKVASTFECELGCQCLYENGVNLQVSEVCVYATYLVFISLYILLLFLPWGLLQIRFDHMIVSAQKGRERALATLRYPGHLLPTSYYIASTTSVPSASATSDFLHLVHHFRPAGFLHFVHYFRGRK